MDACGKNACRFAGSQSNHTQANLGHKFPAISTNSFRLQQALIMALDYEAKRITKLAAHFDMVLEHDETIATLVFDVSGTMSANVMMLSASQF